ncbi:MAG: hypothetical protein U1E78_05425 [Gammaproteobacteria bacterium]
MIFRVGAEHSSRRSVHKVHDRGENREGNNPENSAAKGIVSASSYSLIYLKIHTGIYIAMIVILHLGHSIKI